MSLSAKREALARIHGRDQRADRPALTAGARAASQAGTLGHAARPALAPRRARAIEGTGTSGALCAGRLPPDNGGEFLHWTLHRHLTGRAVNEQKNWTHVRQLFGHERFGHPELVPLMNDLSAQEWSQFTNHFKPTFKLRRREK